MILGMDWLEAYSPIRVHWRQKWLSITYNRSLVTLYDAEFGTSDRLLIQISATSVLQPEGGNAKLCLEIEALLGQFSSVTLAPTSLPPIRSCDHAIPLLMGVKLVNIRP